MHCTNAYLCTGTDRLWRGQVLIASAYTFCAALQTALPVGPRSVVFADFPLVQDWRPTTSDWPPIPNEGPHLYASVHLRWAHLLLRLEWQARHLHSLT